MKMMILTRAGAVPFAARSQRQSLPRFVARVIASAAVIGALVCAAEPAAAQFTQQGPKLVGSGSVGRVVNQGFSVAVSGDGNTAMVGGYGDDSNFGAAWVFTRSNGVWAQQGNKLVGTDAFGQAWQGYSVALSADGNTAIVGAPSYGTVGGAARVFTRSNGVWSQQGNELVGAGAVGPAVYQGIAVAVSADGNTAIVGGPGDAGFGAAWVFTRSNGVWSQQGNKLVGSGASIFSAPFQGFSVALSGDGNTAIVGGPYDAGGGAAWVFVRSNGVWTQQGNKLVGTGAAVGPPGPQQGWSVALSGDGNTAIIGGFEDNDFGAAWVFARSNGVWTQQGNKLVGSGAVGQNPNQGISVALSVDGNIAMIGGSGDSSGVGAAWVFRRSNGVWAQWGDKLVGTGAVGPVNPWQGSSVALSADGSTAIIGGPQDNVDVGAAWVFTAPPPPKPKTNTHDFNGDGMSDIALRDVRGNTAIWLMNGAAILSSGELGTVPTSWSMVGQRDFNGDGNADLLWRNTNGDTSVWLMNGTQVSATPSLGVVGNGWSIVGTGDFNADGYGDILWRNTNGDTSVWLMTGSPTQVQVLSATDLGLVATSWSVAQTGDFNGDGMADILWHNVSGDTMVWLMNGSQLIASIDLGVIPQSWTIAGTGDFNGDHISDILWHNANGDTSMWLMTGSGPQVQVSSTNDLGLIPTSWNVALTGDFNNDGMSDILWRNSNGDASIWFMNGTSVSSVGSLGIISTGWVPWTVQSMGAE